MSVIQHRTQCLMCVYRPTLNHVVLSVILETIYISNHVTFLHKSVTENQSLSTEICMFKIMAEIKKKVNRPHVRLSVSSAPRFIIIINVRNQVQCQ